ncbi:MAG: formyl-CoA transferase, partial [bacterium]
TGLWMVGGIATALYARERTGRGQQIDLALMDGQFSLLGFQGAGYLLTGKIPARYGNAHPMLTPYATFAAADGWINVAVVTPGQWEAFCAVIEHPELADDPRFRTNPDRVAHRAELDAVIEPIFRTRPRDEWLQRLTALDIPAGAVRNVAEALESPQCAAREMVIELEHPTLGVMRQVGLPLKFSDTPGAPSGPPPLHGGQTDQVLAELCGLTPETLADLKKRHIIKG